MDLGHFSVSLAVKDISASRKFYETLGFEAFDGSHNYPDMNLPEGQDWLMLKHGNAMIGLFQGMFEDNVLTFNPPDVRAIQKKLKESGYTVHVEADESTTGPAHATIMDPDGNAILIDQH